MKKTTQSKRRKAPTCPRCASMRVFNIGNEWFCRDCEKRWYVKKPAPKSRKLAKPMSDFQKGAMSVARSSRAALELIQKGTWTINQAIKWIDAVIEDDGEIARTPLAKAIADLLFRSPDSSLYERHLTRINRIEQLLKKHGV